MACSLFGANPLCDFVEHILADQTILKMANKILFIVLRVNVSRLFTTAFVVQINHVNGRLPVDSLHKGSAIPNVWPCYHAIEFVPPLFQERM